MKSWTIVGALILAGVWSAGISAADFNGDGTPDVAVFRPTSGLWAVRALTRVYFGQSGDVPVAGDYNGVGSDAPAVFRSTSGLWAVRGVTRLYFGGGTDQAVAGDYSGNGRNNFAVFRSTTGLWAVRNLTRLYFGSADDLPVPTGRTARKGLLRTGQSTSQEDYDDGYYQAGLAFSYQTEAPNPSTPGQVVTIDKVTGLMWATYGERAGCNYGNQTDWSSALAWAEGLTYAGYSDWRIPNIRELLSLVDFGQYNPAIRTRFFPDTKTDQNYWSSTVRDDNPSGFAWDVSYISGQMYYSSPSAGKYVRPVRGGI